MSEQNVNEVAEKIHDHAEEVENSRPQSNLTRRSNSSLGPLRTGRGTPIEIVTTASSPAQDLSKDITRKSPLPPIGSENVEEYIASSESEVDLNLTEVNTEKLTQLDRPERKRHPKVLKGYRSEPFDPAEKKYEFPTQGKKESEKVVLKDGQTRTLVSMECQTEWSWMEDMRRMEAFNEMQNRQSALTSGHDADADDDSDDDDEEEEIRKTPSKQGRKTPESPISMVEAKSPTPPKPSSSPTISTAVLSKTVESSIETEVPKVKVKEMESRQSQASTKGKTTGTSISGGHRSSTHLAPSIAPSMAPSLRDDDYGIPILQLSTDTDSSDEESLTEMQDSDQMREAYDTLGTLPSIGPPQILQYNRESEKKDIDPGDPENLDPELITKLGGAIAGKLSQLLPSSPQGGMFQGTCEFCGNAIKKFPTMEEQKALPPEKLYCCNEYRQFVQFMISHPLHEKLNVDKMIDISPHAPYGSKQARNAAKERAAQRMRARELARQQATIGTMGGGGTGGPSNFYQWSPSTNNQQTAAEDSSTSISSVLTESMQPTGSYATLVGIARQMKTINYCLSSQKCLEEGWTIKPPSPLMEGDEEAELFEPQPVLPPWADPQKQYQLYHSGCTHKYKPHFHNIFYQPDATRTTHRDSGLVRKFYADGSKFIILFPDGTGNVFYPSGRVAVSIVALEDMNRGLYSYIVTEDAEVKAKVLAVFENNGSGTTYYPKGDIRVCLDQLGGVELDAHGAKKRKWSWKDQIQHVHAPPIQPITLAINPQVAVRIMGQDNISLTFTASKRSVRFQVGAHLKLVSPENIPEPEIDDDQLFRDEVKNRIQELLLKVNNLLKFPKSPKLDKLPNPPHLTARQQKTEKLRNIRRERTMAKEKKPQAPVVVVN